MFDRSRQALLDLDRLGDLSTTSPLATVDAKTLLPRFVFPFASIPHGGPASTVPHSLASFYARSGWSDVLKKYSTTANDPIFPSVYSSTYLGATPVFWRGKQYQLVCGDDESPETTHFADLKIDGVAHAEYRFPAYGAFHLLIQEVPQVHILEDIVETLTEAQREKVVQDILLLIPRIHAQGFKWYGMHEEYKPNPDYKVVAGMAIGYPNMATGKLKSEFYCYQTPQGVQLLLLTTKDTKRYPIGNLGHNALHEEKEDVLRYVQQIGGPLPEYTGELLLPSWERKRNPPWPNAPKEPILPPYAPQYTQSESPHLLDWTSYIPEAYGTDDSGHSATVMGFLELIQAVASKGLLPPLPSEDDRSESPWNTMGILADIYIQNLALFGPTRTHPAILATPDEIDKYLDDLHEYRTEYSYQSMYQKWASRGIRKTTDDDSEDYSGLLAEGGDRPRAPALLWVPFIRSLEGLVPESPQFMRRWSLQRWLAEEPETSLPIAQGITLHGIEFAEDLMRLFYQTPLATAAEFGALTYNPPWLSAEDVILIQDFLEGRIMPGVFYKQLSQNAFNVLFTTGSFLDLYEYLPFRLVMDESFVFGVPVLQQLANFSTKEVYAIASTKIPMMETFLGQITN